MSGKDRDRSGRPAVTSPRLWMGAVIAGALVVGVFAAWRLDRSGEGSRGLGGRAEYGIEAYERIDPGLIRYAEAGEIATGMREPRGVAVGPDDRIYVAGDRVVRIFEPSGARAGEIPLEDEPLCLAVAGPDHVQPGRIYLGMTDYVLPVSAAGETRTPWDRLKGKPRLTSLAVAEEDVFVADAGNAVVLRYDAAGTLVGRIGERDKARGIPGLVIPSPFFDVAVAPDGLLWVVNPGALRLEAYSPDGQLERFWGKGSAAVDGFFGCCNPAHIAILPEDRIVTAEKGLLRVKVYSLDGELECVVAGPQQLDGPSKGTNLLDQEHKAVDVAVDSRQRVLVLDPARRTVRVFVSSQPSEVGTSRSEGEQAG